MALQRMLTVCATLASVCVLSNAITTNLAVKANLEDELQDKPAVNSDRASAQEKLLMRREKKSKKAEGDTERRADTDTLGHLAPSNDGTPTFYYTTDGCPSKCNTAGGCPEVTVTQKNTNEDQDCPDRNTLAQHKITKAGVVCCHHEHGHVNNTLNETGVMPLLEPADPPVATDLLAWENPASTNHCNGGDYPNHKEEMNHEQATKFCHDRGGRLCTFKEVYDGIACDAGCNMNCHLVWTETAAVSEHKCASTTDNIAEGASCVGDPSKVTRETCCNDDGIAKGNTWDVTQTAVHSGR